MLFSFLLSLKIVGFHRPHPQYIQCPAKFSPLFYEIDFSSKSSCSCSSSSSSSSSSSPSSSSPHTNSDLVSCVAPMTLIVDWRKFDQKRRRRVERERKVTDKKKSVAATKKVKHTRDFPNKKSRSYSSVKGGSMKRRKARR